MRSCLLSSFVEFLSAVSEEKSKMSQPIRGRVAILFFQSAWKNSNLVGGVEILLPVKFWWNLFSGFRGEVENVLANQRPGRPSCFSDWPEKHKLDRGRWHVASCQVWLNSVQQFQRSGKWLSQSEARVAILFFRSAQKNANLVEDVEMLLPVKFGWIPLTTKDGQRVITIVDLSLLLRCTKKHRWTVLFSYFVFMALHFNLLLINLSIYNTAYSMCFVNIIFNLVTNFCGFQVHNQIYLCTVKSLPYHSHGKFYKRQSFVFENCHFLILCLRIIHGIKAFSQLSEPLFGSAYYTP